MSKSEFIDQANAICQAASDEAEPMFEDFEDLDESQVFVEFADIARQIQPIWNEMTDDIRALAEPDEDRELIETLMDDLDAAVHEFVETSAAAADGDQAAMQALDDDSEDPFDSLNRRAREYGLTVCAIGFDDHGASRYLDPRRTRLRALPFSAPTSPSRGAIQ